MEADGIKPPKYDKNGVEYCYKAVETAISYSASGDDWITVKSGDSLSDELKEQGITQAVGSYRVGDAGYEQEQDGTWTTSTTNTLIAASVTATKSWSDENDRDNARGSSLKFQLKQKGSGEFADFGTSVEIKKKSDGTWPSYTWQNLPLYQLTATAYSDATKYIYKAEEVNTTIPANYTVSYEYPEGAASDGSTAVGVYGDSANGAEADADSKVTVKNTRSMDRFTVTATKSWTDFVNRYDIRQDVNVKLQYLDKEEWKDVDSRTMTDGLYGDGSGVYTTSTITQKIYTAEGDVFSTAKWENLPVNRIVDGKSEKIKYRVAEVSINGYEASYSVTGAASGTVNSEQDGTKSFTGTAGQEIAVTVTNTLETTSLEVTKTWAGDTAALRPKRVRFRLLYTTTQDQAESWSQVPEEQTYILTAPQEDSGSTVWSGTVANLPKTDSYGTPYAYKAVEDAISYSVSGDDWIAVKTEESQVTAALGTGEDDRSQLYGVVGSYRVGNATFTKVEVNDTWTWTSGTTNTLIAASVKVTKLWKDEEDRDGTRGEGKLSFTLLQKGTGSEPFEYATGEIVKSQGVWSACTWKDLPLYQLTADSYSDETKYIYSVKETQDTRLTSGAYTVSYEYPEGAASDGSTAVGVYGDMGNNAAGVTADASTITVKNTRTAMERFTATATKAWEDTEDLYGIRPEEASVTLQYWDVTSQAEDKWTDVIHKDSITPETPYEDGTGVYTTSAVVQTIDSEIPKAEWKNLPLKRIVGNTAVPVKYRVIEVDVPAGYDVSYEVAGQASADVIQETDGSRSFTAKQQEITVQTTVTNTLQTTSLEVKKTWIDAEQPDLRPAQIKFEVFYKTENDTSWKNVQEWKATPGEAKPEGEKQKLEVILESKDGWSNTVSNLPKYDASGAVYQYKAVETALGYRTGELTWIPVQTDAPAIRQALALGMDASLEEIYGVVGSYRVGNATFMKVEANGTWTWKSGTTNTLIAASVKVVKRWEDENDRDNKRGASLAFDLYQDLQLSGSAEPFREDGEITRQEDGTWSSYTWKNLPLYRLTATEYTDDTKYVYSVKEEESSIHTTDHYQVTYEYLADAANQREAAVGVYGDIGNNGDGTTASASTIVAVNTRTPDTFTITADKEWLNKNDFAFRPTEVTLELQAATVVLDADGNPNYGKYAPVVTKTEANSTKGSGTEVYTTSDLRQTLTVSNADGNNSNKWTGARWEGLPVNSGGYPVHYKVVEISLGDNYVVEASTDTAPITGTADGTYNASVRNKLKGTVTAAVTKQWPNGETGGYEMLPKAVNVQLQYSEKDKNKWSDVTANGTATLTASGNWSDSFGDAKHPLDSQYDYRIIEVSLVYGNGSGDTTVPVQYTSTVEEGITVTNQEAGTVGGFTYGAETSYKEETSTWQTTLTNTLQTTELTVVKEWKDQDNYYGTRPTANLTVKLQRRLADSEAAGNEWQDVKKDGTLCTTELVYDTDQKVWDNGTFTGMPRKNATGQLYEYRAVEADATTGVTEAVTGYTQASVQTTKDGRNCSTITNTLETVDVSGTKTWEDWSDEYGYRPDTVTLTVTRRKQGTDGSNPENETEGLPAQPEFSWDYDGDCWTYKITGLPKYYENKTAGGELEEVTYLLTETVDPDYEADAETVTVTKKQTGDGEIRSADFVNTLIIPERGIGLVKKDIQNPEGAAVTGDIRGEAEFTVKGIFAGDETGDGEREITVTTADTSALDDKLLPCNEEVTWTYTLTETKAPAGYELAASVEFRVNQEGDIVFVSDTETAGFEENSGILTVYDMPVELMLAKTDTEDQVIDAGRGEAEFTIRTTGDQTFADGSREDITGVTPSTSLEQLRGKLVAQAVYQLVETKAPVGYELAVTEKAPVYFKVDPAGEITLTDEAGNDMAGTVSGETEGTAADTVFVSGSAIPVLTVRDARIEIQLRKADRADGRQITDTPAEISLYEGTGTDMRLIQSGLTAGGGELLLTEAVLGEPWKINTAYTLQETKSPDGYAVAEAFTFTVDENGNISSLSEGASASFAADTSVLTLLDDKTVITIEKKNASGEQLAGARMVIEDEDHQAVYQFTTQAEPEIVSGILNVGQTYLLSELEAPSGYHVAEDVRFTVPQNGVLTVEMTDPAVQAEQETASLTVEKIVTYQGSPLSVNHTFYTALFADEALTKRVTDVKALELKGAYSAEAVFDHLTPGMTYYAGETDELGIPVQSNELFEVKLTNAAVTPAADGAVRRVLIENSMRQLPDYYYEGVPGTIQVTKRLQKDGRDVTRKNAVFYVRLFADAEFTFPVSDVKTLDLGNGSSAEVLFEGLAAGVYYVMETDKAGNPVDETDENFRYVLTRTEESITVEDGQNYRTTLINEPTYEDETESETETETESETGKAGSVKTGDDTPILPLCGMLMVSALAILLMFRRRRRQG